MPYFHFRSCSSYTYLAHHTATTSCQTVATSVTSDMHLTTLATAAGAQAGAPAGGSTGSIEVVNVDDDLGRKRHNVLGRSLWCCCAGGTSKRNCRLSCVSTVEEAQVDPGSKYSYSGKSSKGRFLIAPLLYSL